MLNTIEISQMVLEIDRFFLCAFNRLAHNHEISELLATITILSLPNFYNSEKLMKQVNIKTFRLYFPNIILKNVEDNEAAKTFIPFDSSKMMPISIFNDYYY